jgi:DNA-directed RNA polymerase beta' subunit
MKHLLDLEAPPIIVDRERRMLQDCVDYLFDNAVCPDPVMSKDGSHRLRSLADLIDPPHGLLENVTFGGPTGP